MEINTDIQVILETDSKKSTFTFSDEHVDVSRATRLWIRNLSEKESDFFETVKMWRKMDLDTGITSYYQIKTSEPSSVQPLTYVVENVNLDTQSITFKEV